MLARRFLGVCIVAGALSVLAQAQTNPSGPSAGATGASELNESRLLAGLREYPGVVRRSLLRLAAEPALV